MLSALFGTARCFAARCRAVRRGGGGWLPAEVEAEEKTETAEEASWLKNAKLGRFTNFVNLLDLAAVAVPAGVVHCTPNPNATGAPGCLP